MSSDLQTIRALVHYLLCVSLMVKPKISANNISVSLCTTLTLLHYLPTWKKIVISERGSMKLSRRLGEE